MPHSTTAVQLYTVRDTFALDPVGTLGRLAAMGFTSVEPYRFIDFEDPLTEARERFGLSIPTGHCRLDGGNRDEVFASATRLGMSTVIEPRIPIERWADQGSVEEVAAELESAAMLAREYGLTVGYHNHAFELQIHVDGRTALEALADAAPSIAFEVDAYWAFVGGVDVPALLAALGERVIALHIKDGARSSGNADQCHLGDGAVPIGEILAAAPKALRVLELDATRHDPFEVLAHGLRYLAADGSPRPDTEVAS